MGYRQLITINNNISDLDKKIESINQILEEHEKQIIISNSNSLNKNPDIIYFNMDWNLSPLKAEYVVMTA